MIHQLTPRRKSDTLTPVRKLISPEAERADSGHASRQRESHHRLVDQQQQQQQRRQDRHHSIQPPKLQKGASDDTSSSSSSSSSSDDGFDSDDDNDNSTSSQFSHQAAAATTTTTTLDRASLIASLRPNTNTEGLSDYELLRLQKIQRNEAKLASLGLCGITTKNATNVHSGGSNNNNNGSSSNDHESSAQKAANTRRKNAANAKKMVELYERSLPQHRTTRPRVLPSTDKSPNYITTAAATAANPNSRIEQWKTRYSELQSFISKYGTYDMLTRNLENGKYKPLCDWWNRQRLQYTKYKIGTKSTLGDEQIRLLDNLDDGRWRARKGGDKGGGGETSVRGGGAGGGTNTSRRLWKASTDSETEDEDEYTWERINRDEQDEEEVDVDDEEDEYEEEEEEVDESSTEAEEVDIDAVDSYSDESSTSVAIDDNFTEGHPKMKNGMRASYSSRERAARKPKRKRNSSISRRDKLSSTPAKRRRRGSLAIVSSLEKIPPSATKIVDSGEFASKSHRIDKRVHLRSMERRYNDDLQYASDEEEETEDDDDDDDDDKESIISMEHDDIGRDFYRVVGPDSCRYHHRNTIHRQNYRRYREYTHHRHHHRHGRHGNRWHRPVSEIIIAPLERDQHRRRHHHHHHNRSVHQKYQNHHYQQQMQLQKQIMEEREALLREYGQLYKRKCVLADQMTIEMQYFSRYMIGSSSSRLESMTISTPSTAPTVATSSSSSSRIRSAYSTTSTTTMAKTAASVAVSTATAAAATATASVIESYHRRW